MRIDSRSAARVIGAALIGLATVAAAASEGGDPPGHGSVEIQVFAPGVVSTPDAAEYFPTFTPDGRSVYFARAAAFDLESRRTILVSRLEKGAWTEPEVASFSGTYSDTDPFLSPDGTSLFFASNRPVDGSPKKDTDLWVVRREGEGWGEPRHLGSTINSATPENSPVVTRDGTLYFRSSREGGLGQGDLYRADPSTDGYGEPVNLGPPVNSPTGEWNLLVEADRRFLIFEASGRPTNVSASGDLYISYPEDDTWSEPRPLSLLNTAASELGARLSPDGVWLYFASNRDSGDNVEIYRVQFAEVSASMAR